MFTSQAILEQLTGRPTVQAFLEAMAEKFVDFAQDRKGYEDAMDLLKTELGDAAVAAEAEAIYRQTASTLLFSGLLGLKANLDNFIDPVGKSFLDVDFEIYLREETAHRLPEYAAARQARERFYARLSPQQQEIYGDVITYTTHLETVGPKLAHYYGYLLGNDLLPRVVPGYHADPVQTARYAAMLRSYFGRGFER